MDAQKKQQANIGGLIALITAISTILPYIMQILEALGGKKETDVPDLEKDHVL